MDLDLGNGSGVAATGRSSGRLRTPVSSWYDLFATTTRCSSGRCAPVPGATWSRAPPPRRSSAPSGRSPTVRSCSGPRVAARAIGFLSGSRNALHGSFAGLTDRERDVLQLLARGLDNATIARTLVLSSKTVRDYVYAISPRSRRSTTGPPSS